MFKKNIKPILMAGALALATAVSPVLAEGVQGDPTQTIYNNDTITINKALSYAAGITGVTNKTFTFSITPQGNNSSTAPIVVDATDTNATSAIEYYITLGGVTTDDTDNTKSGYKTVKFVPTTSTTPDIYEYELKEVVPTTEDSDIKYNTNGIVKYKVKVRVENTSAGGQNTLEVKAITIAPITLSQDGTETEGTKVGSADFANSYTEDNAGKLVLTKNISGTGSDKNDEFTFTVQFTAPTTAKEVDYEYTKTLQSGEDETSVEKSINDGVVTVNLKDKEFITFENLPAGTTYTIIETEDKGYDTTSISGSGTVDTENAKKVSGTLTDAEAGNTETYTNTKNSSPLTGVIVNNMPYIALLGASGAGLVVLAASKKRSKK